jgi:glycosyltransferase involved in cell wall biosynthesis
MTISAVIPVRNRETLVARAIESVIAQSLPVDELVVVDDASTDDTARVVEGYADKVRALKLMRLKENVGGAKARNVGIEAAKGDLIAFLDSDDVWYADKLLKQAREFEGRPDRVAAYCGVVMRWGDKEFRFRSIPPNPILTQADLYHASVIVTMSCALVSRQALLEIGGFDASLPSCQDWDLYLRLSDRGSTAVIQEDLVEYWRHTGERISRNRQSVLAGHEAVFGKIYGRISDPALKRDVRASHEMRLADIFSTDCFEPLRAIRHACKGLMLGPSRDRAWRFRSVMTHVVKNSLLPARS